MPGGDHTRRLKLNCDQKSRGSHSHVYMTMPLRQLKSSVREYLLHERSDCMGCPTIASELGRSRLSFLQTFRNERQICFRTSN